VKSRQFGGENQKNPVGEGWELKKNKKNQRSVHQKRTGGKEKTARDTIKKTGLGAGPHRGGKKKRKGKDHPNI